MVDANNMSARSRGKVSAIFITLSCTGRGPAMGRSFVQGILQNSLLMFHNSEPEEAQTHGT
jgi:hypothetical protein